MKKIKLSVGVFLQMFKFVYIYIYNITLNLTVQGYNCFNIGINVHLLFINIT